MKSCRPTRFTLFKPFSLMRLSSVSQSVNYGYMIISERSPDVSYKCALYPGNLLIEWCYSVSLLHDLTVIK